MINVLTSYFNHPDPHRRKELLDALTWNLENKHIDKVIVFEESPLDVEHKKLIKVESERPTYQDFFNMTANYPSDFNVIANSDIFFDDSILNVHKMGDGVCYCITRHEWRGGRALPFQDAHGKTAKAEWSQDVWVFKGASRVKNCDEILAENLRDRPHHYEVIAFWLGIGGCDNVIAKRIFLAGYLLKNPYMDIRCLHNHANKNRPNYTHRMTGAANQWSYLKRVPASGL